MPYPGRGEARVKLRQRQASKSSRSHPPASQEPPCECFPDVLAPQRLDRHDAGLTPLAALDHALDRFQSVEVVAVQSAIADADGLGDFCAQGTSTAGNRQVTGSDEPAMSGKPSSLAVSTMLLAHSQFQDRCLSLKTGTERPLAAEDRRRSAGRTRSADRASGPSRSAG